MTYGAVSSHHVVVTTLQAIEIISGRGEIGKHKGLKIPRLNGLAGSSPAARTTFLGHLKLTLWNSYVLHKACAEVLHKWKKI